MSNDFYCLVMFPYPSGDGLHIGHFYNYAIMDSYCRVMSLKGLKVFQPFGYDAFGLPAENYAKSIGGDPRQVTEANIENFRKQLIRMNTNFTEKLVTSHSSYYKWSQWLFLELHKRGLAYQKMGEVNWCPGCETVLANEQVKEEKCDRCKAKIETKYLKQWYFKITEYKDRLIENLKSIDYPKSTIEQQRHWLNNLNDWCVSRQRKWGTPIPLDGEEDTLDTFVDSSFYYIRYCDPDNEKELCSKEKYRHVDLYVGGNEHACMHLIYARFINMFLFDIGVVPEEEPFKKLIHQGMIKNAGMKMSKSLGNSVSPDEYDSDVLRMYLMFIGHYFDGGEWSDQNINGIIKFFNRLKKWLNNADSSGVDVELDAFQKTIFDFVERFKFNKVVSEFMIFLNKHSHIQISIKSKDNIVDLIRLFAPGFDTEA